MASSRASDPRCSPLARVLAERCTSALSSHTSGSQPARGRPRERSFGYGCIHCGMCCRSAIEFVALAKGLGRPAILFFAVSQLECGSLDHSMHVAEAAIEGHSVLLPRVCQLSCSWSARGWKSPKVSLGTDLEDNFAAAYLEVAAESDASIASLLWSFCIGDDYLKRSASLNAAIVQGLQVSLHLPALEPKRAAAGSCTLIGLGELFWSSSSSRMACHQHLSDAAAA